MKNCLLLFLFISFISFAFGQSRQGLYKVDSLQFYNSNKSQYEFSMIKKSQGFFLDSICYQSKPYIEVNIVNDSKDALINYYQARDSRILWYEKKGKYNDTLFSATLNRNRLKINSFGFLFFGIDYIINQNLKNSNFIICQCTK